MKGIKIDFISSSVLDDKSRDERIKFILKKVSDGSILITDGVLKADEEMDLIKETMRRVDDGFPGIEVTSLKRTPKGLEFVTEKFNDQKEKIQGFFSGVMGKEVGKTSVRGGLTLIGPAKVIKKIKNNPESFSVFAGV